MAKIQCTFQFNSEVTATITAESEDAAIDQAITDNADAFPDAADFDSSVNELDDGEWGVILAVTWEEEAEFDLDEDDGDDPECFAQLKAAEVGAELLSFELVA